MQIFVDNPGVRITATSVEWDYNIIEAAGLDYWTVRAALLAVAPISNAPPGATYAWPRRGLSLKEIDCTMGVWKATITWSSLNYQYALKIGGQQQTVRADKFVVKGYAAGGATIPAAFADNNKGVVIGWDGRSVHGTSIYVPQRTWTESVEIPLSDYTFDYEDRVAAIDEAPVNSEPFRGYDPGEVLFLGMQAQLSTQNPDFVSAAFEFTRSPNRNAANGNDLTVGTITGIDKDGWDFLDPFFQPTVDVNLIPSPTYVLIHRMYDRSNFADLNIGTDENLPLWQG